MPMLAIIPPIQSHIHIPDTIPLRTHTIKLTQTVLVRDPLARVARARDVDGRAVGSAEADVSAFEGVRGGDDDVAVVAEGFDGGWDVLVSLLADLLVGQGGGEA